uniref:MATE efflux family protein 1 n=1 Tax=Rhizophora mucronata TaxID=61149 RepID=A0A2P2Q7H7_RHIMU
MQKGILSPPMDGREEPFSAINWTGNRQKYAKLWNAISPEEGG